MKSQFKNQTINQKLVVENELLKNKVEVLAEACSESLKLMIFDMKHNDNDCGFWNEAIELCKKALGEFHQ